LKYPQNGLIYKEKLMRKIAGLAAAVAITASALVAAPAYAADNVTAGGSSFSAKMLQTCAANYSAATVTYTASSSGTGRTNFANGTFDFAGSDGAYGSADAKPKGAYAYVPVLGGPIAIIFNLDGVKNLRLDATTIGAIFQGTVKTWNDPAIAKLNPGVKLPATAITPEYRGSKSGTNGNFSGYLVANKATGWTADQTWTTATGKSTPAGVGGATSANVVSNVKSTAGAIGYVDLADAVAAGLPYATVKNAAGQFVKPTTAGASKFLAGQAVNNDGTVAIDWAKKVPGGYNASVITYAVVPTETSKNGAAVKGFMSYVLTSCVPANAAKLGYVSLTGAISAKAKAVVATIK
jgi:phosphate transport system substrate-binding protein